MTATRWHYSTVKDPFTGRFLGISTTTAPNGDPVTLHTVDDFGDMLTFETAAEADAAINEVMFALMNLKWQQPSEITPEQIGREVRDMDPDFKLQIKRNMDENTEGER